MLFKGERVEGWLAYAHPSTRPNAMPALLRMNTWLLVFLFNFFPRDMKCRGTLFYCGFVILRDFVRVLIRTGFHPSLHFVLYDPTHPRPLSPSLQPGTQRGEKRLRFLHQTLSPLCGSPCVSERGLGCVCFLSSILYAPIQT